MAEATRIEIGPRRTAHVYGPGGWKYAAAAHIPTMLCPYCRTLTIPADRAQDLATWIEHHKRPVSVTAVLV